MWIVHILHLISHSHPQKTSSNEIIFYKNTFFYLLLYFCFVLSNSPLTIQQKSYCDGNITYDKEGKPAYDEKCITFTLEIWAFYNVFLINFL